MKISLYFTGFVTAVILLWGAVAVVAQIVEPEQVATPIFLQGVATSTASQMTEIQQTTLYLQQQQSEAQLLELKLIRQELREIKAKI